MGLAPPGNCVASHSKLVVTQAALLTGQRTGQPNKTGSRSDLSLRIIMIILSNDSTRPQPARAGLVKATYPDARVIDLLRTDEYVRYAQRPGLLSDELRDATPGNLTIIDEIQKVPALLDEVHWLIENRGLVFWLCGSSARKQRRPRQPSGGTGHSV